MQTEAPQGPRRKDNNRGGEQTYPRSDRTSQEQLVRPSSAWQSIRRNKNVSTESSEDFFDLDREIELFNLDDAQTTFRATKQQANRPTGRRSLAGTAGRIQPDVNSQSLPRWNQPSCNSPVMSRSWQSDAVLSTKVMADSTLRQKQLGSPRIVAKLETINAEYQVDRQGGAKSLNKNTLPAAQSKSIKQSKQVVSSLSQNTHNSSFKGYELYGARERGQEKYGVRRPSEQITYQYPTTTVTPRREQGSTLNSLPILEPISRGKGTTNVNT